MLDRPTSITQEPTRAPLWLWAIALSVVFADQLSKQWALQALANDRVIEVVPQWLHFFLVHNPGAAFSLSFGSTLIFTIIGAVATVFITGFLWRTVHRGWGITLALLLGGALGNLIDRLMQPPSVGYGHVVDFIYLPTFPFMDFPLFNVADIAITCAAGLMILFSVLGVSPDGLPEEAQTPLPPDLRHSADAPRSDQ